MKIEFILFCVYIYITRTIECAAVEAPLDIITLDDLTPLERAHLQYLRDASSRKKRSGLLSSIGQGLKSKIGLLAQGSASAVSHFSAGSSGHHHAPHHDVPETYDHKSFDFWALKKSILNTLLQAAKAIKGGVIALKGQLIKGSGYLVSAKGKLISSQGEAITNLGKNIASSALLSPHHGHSHSSGYGASGPSYETPHGEYGPPSDHDVEYAAPSAPSPEYGLPDHHGSSDIYQPQKYPSHYDEKHKTLHGYPQGILILKKIQSERHEETQESKIPKFKPLKEHPPAPTFNSFITTLFGSSSHQTSDLHKPPPPPPTADSHHHTPYHDSQPSKLDEEIQITKPTKVTESHPSSLATNLAGPINYLEYFNSAQNNKPSFEMQTSQEHLPMQTFNFQKNSEIINAVDLGSHVQPNRYLSSANPFANYANENIYANVNLPINANDLPNIESFGPYPGPSPTEFISQHNLSPMQSNYKNPVSLLGPNSLQDPRSLNQQAYSLNAFLPTPLAVSNPQLLQGKNYLPPNIPLNNLPKQTRHKTSKRTPNRITSGRINPNLDVVKSITFQLGPNGPVKL